mgnify:CR=1 FL=1
MSTTIRELLFDIAPGPGFTGTVFCESGELATGGGYKAPANSGSQDSVAVGSYPVDDGAGLEGWRVEIWGINGQPPNQVWTVYVVCAS